MVGERFRGSWVSQLIYKNSNGIKQLREKLKRTELENRDHRSLPDYEQLATITYVLNIYIIGICCFSTKYAALKCKTNDWSARNQNKVSELSDMYIRGLLFQ